MLSRLYILAILSTLLQEAFSSQSNSRYSTANLLQTQCLPNTTPIKVTAASSILQCQHFCTANEKCSVFIVKEKNGVKTCRLYEGYGQHSSCVKEDGVAGYSLTRTQKNPAESSGGQNTCRAGSTISYKFPRFSAEDYAKAKVSNSSNLSAFTIAFWAKISQLNSGGTVLLTYRAENSCFDIEIRATSFGFSVKVNGNIINIFEQKFRNNFAHIAFSWSLESASLKLYLNGSLSITHSLTNQQQIQIKGGGSVYLGISFAASAILTSNTHSTTFCIAESASTLQGEISQVFMWNKELSTSSIYSAMKFRADCQDLIIRWNDFSNGMHGNVRVVPLIKDYLLTATVNEKEETDD